MKAKVKRIKIGTIKETKDWKDSFVKGMEFDGFMDFTPRVIEGGKIARDWYYGANWYSYHISWLKDIQE